MRHILKEGSAKRFIAPIEETIFGKFRNIENSFELDFMRSRKKKDEKESTKYQPVPFHRLFRYATCFEKFVMFLGLLMSIISGFYLPIDLMLYSDFVTMLVERSKVNATSAVKTEVLHAFGGGTMVYNGTYEDIREAKMADATAVGIGFALVSCVQLLTLISSILLLNYAAQKQIARIRHLFFESVIRQNMAWYDTTTTSNFASRVTEDLEKLREGIGEKISIFLYFVTSFIAAIIVAFTYGWKLTLVVLSCAPLIVIAQFVVAKVQSSITAKELQSYGEAGAVAEEVLSAIRTVVAFGGEEKEVERYSSKLNKVKATGIKKGVFSGIGAGLMSCITYCVYAVAFWYGIKLIMESVDYTSGTLVIILSGVLLGATNMGMATPHIEAFAVARGSAAAVFSILDRVSEIDSLDEKGMKPTKFSGNIEFENVHFHYPARTDVKILQGLNLNIKCGETVAVVGSSGGGKSTILQLIQRLYDPIQGKVLLDGVDIKQLNVGWLRSNIGLVGQEPILFATTIGENIRYGREGSTQQEIEQAAREANAHDFISKLPKGYDTVVGDRGTQLSGGQKQRIAIARALIRQPNILLLDEATSALDLRSEAKVQVALDRAAKNRTTILVTHRLSTVKNADRIVFVSNGQIVEDGSHTELMELKGHYYGLVTANDSPSEDSEEKEEDTEPENENVSENVNMRVSNRWSVKSGSIRFSKRWSMRSVKSDTGKYAELEEDLSPEEQKQVYNVSLGRILALNKPEWLHCLIGCLASVIVGSSLPVLNTLFGEVIGLLSETDEVKLQTQANKFSLLFLIIGIVAGISAFFQMYSFGLAGVHLTSRLRAQAFSAMLRQEIGWYDEEKNSVGILCARLSGDATNVEGATGSRIGVILQASSTIVISIVLSLIFNWSMALVSLISFAFVFMAIFIDSKVVQKQGFKEKNAMETATKIAVETIINIRTVLSLCAEKMFLKNYVVNMEEAQKVSNFKTRLRGIVFCLGQTAPMFGYALSLYFGGYLFSVGKIDFKDIIKVSEILIFGAMLLGQSLAFIPNYSVAKMAAGRIFNLIDRKPLISKTENAGGNNNWSLQEANGKIKYSGVDFRYPTRPGIPILKGLNLQIEPGQTVALVGPSGCGKSTCIQLLQRFYDPDRGTLSVDGSEVSSIPLQHLRAQLGIVSQEPTLFDLTIAENIAYGDNSRAVSMEEIIEASKKSNIHNFISSLPLGYDTRVGSKGTQLSGGQKQRIAIARALVRNPRILLLDEATSALDTQSEKIVQEALDQAREGRTCITIAHRLATVQSADVICVFNRGVVVEMGSHAELLQKNGFYCDLLKQAGGSS